MSISNIAGLSQTNNSSAASNNSNKAAEQKDLFMKLLVAQLKNQDPLEPQNGAEFVAQLAQFNSLEQLTGMRQSLDELAAAMRNNSAAARISD